MIIAAVLSLAFSDVFSFYFCNGLGPMEAFWQFLFRLPHKSVIVVLLNIYYKTKHHEPKKDLFSQVLRPTKQNLSSEFFGTGRTKFFLILGITFFCAY